MPTAAAIDFSTLSVAERIDLIGNIWDSIVDENPDDAAFLSEADRLELHRRLAAHEADPTQAVPWETVRAELFGESV